MENFKINKASIIISIIIASLFLVGIGKRYISTINNPGDWNLYDSTEYSQADTFPDGFRFEYPGAWEVSNLEKGGTKNLGELRVSLFKPNYFFTPSTYLQIWWRRVDNSWTLEDVRDWYVEDIAFGVDQTELEEKQYSFRKIEIGKGNYPALVQTFSRFEGGNSYRQVFLLIENDEAFAFSFHTGNIDESITSTFEGIINTVEIYR